MKWTLFIVALWATSNASAQTDAFNLDKYWKFRNNFVEQFVKIGPQQGESIMAGKRKPCTCIDNVPPLNTWTCYGEMHWGDGTIKHGHYLGFLATEYALLKRYNQPLTGTLNELYYALNALKRIDRDAELNLDDIYDIPSFYGPSENGFYLREDVGEDFVLQFSNEQWEMGCTNSAYYHNTNAAKVHDPSSQYNLIVKNNSYQNVPSADQMTSLLVGLTVAHKLVDNVYVRPTSSDAGFYLKDEIENIVDRLVSYAAERNWFLIDVNGWPVTNGGGDLILIGYPMLKIAEEITGNTYNPEVRRKLLPGYKKIQHCVTGFGITSEDPADAAAVCQSIEYNNYQSLFPLSLAYLENGVPAGAYNNQNESIFQNWQANAPLAGGVGSYISTTIESLDNLWENVMPENYSTWYQDWVTDSIFDNFVFPFNLIKAERLNLTPNNNTIFFNLGILTKEWRRDQVYQWASISDNRELELINAVLRDEMPYKNKAFYQAYLDEMNQVGPFFLHGKEGNYKDSLLGSNGWGGEYRWVDIDYSNGIGVADDGEGIYSALDYLYFHNLYYLLFDDDLPPFEKQYDCMCAPVVNKTYDGNSSLGANAALNYKLTFIENCVKNVFEPINNMVFGTFNIEPAFSEYTEIAIKPTKFQLENAVIQQEGTANVYTDFVICNQKTLTVNTGGFLNVEKGDVFINTNGVLDIYGTVRIKKDQKIDFVNIGTIRLRNGGKLIIEDGGTMLLDYGSVMEYYNGGKLIMEGADSRFIMRGTVKMMNGGVFQPDHSASAESGQFIIEGTTSFITQNNATQNAVVILEGKNKTDEFLYFEKNSNFTIDNYAPSNIDKLIIRKTKVTIKDNVRIKCYQELNCSDATFFSNVTNAGIEFSDKNNFVNCHFQDVPLYAYLYLENKDRLNINGCEFVSSPTINEGHNALVKVKGMSMSVINTQFLGSKLACIESSSFTAPSYVNSCTFSFVTPSTNNTVSGISDVSGAEIRVLSCNFSNLYAGAQKFGGKLSIKCSQLGPNYYSSAVVGSGCHLNLSNDDAAGYNYFYNQGASPIKLSSASINLKNGRNYFQQNAPRYIEGNLNTPCGGINECALDVSRNQWGGTMAPPAQNQFAIYGSDGLAYLVSANLTEAIPLCGAYDNGGGNPNPSGIAQVNSGRTNLQAVNKSGSLFPIITLNNGQPMSLDVALELGIANMQFIDSTGFDSEAIAIFDAIFDANLDKSQEGVKEILSTALLNMKTTVEHGIEAGTMGLNGTGDDFDSNVQKYVDALNFMTDSVITDQNYKVQFYHELDKAHLFRSLHLYSQASELLDELDYCGIDSAEQLVLNSWRKEFDLNVLVDQIGFAVLDSAVSVDTSGYTSPVSYQPVRYFIGSIINGVNDILYVGCTENAPYRMWNGKSIFVKSNLNVAPNPATDNVTISFVDFGDNLPNELRIRSVDGRYSKKHNLSLEDLLNGKEIDVSELSRGTYFCEVLHAHYGTISVKFILQ